MATELELLSGTGCGKRRLRNITYNGESMGDASLRLSGHKNRVLVYRRIFQMGMSVKEAFTRKYYERKKPLPKMGGNSKGA